MAVLLLDRGHMLLVGFSGTLRKTVTRIITYHHKITLCTLSNTRNSSLKDFYRDLHYIIEQASCQSKQVLFLKEHQLGKLSLYEKINSLISSEKIAGLFSSDEIEALIKDPKQLKSEY